VRTETFSGRHSSCSSALQQPASLSRNTTSSSESAIMHRLRVIALSILLALLRIAAPVSLVLFRYDLEGLGEAAATLRESAFRIASSSPRVPPSAETTIPQLDRRSPLRRSAATQTGECIRWAGSVLEDIEDDESRSFGSTIIEHQMERIRKRTAPRRSLPAINAKQIYENMATGVGINMADRWTKKPTLVRLGIKDLEFGRGVLKNCRTS